MRTITTLLFVLVHLASLGQNKIDPTNEFHIVGLVQNETRLTVSDLLKLKSIKIDDIVITKSSGSQERNCIQAVRHTYQRNIREYSI